jgi:hypothetical protein
VAQAVQVAQARLEGVVLVAPHLLNIGAVGGDQGAFAGDQAHDVFQYAALFGCGDRHGSGPRALRPTCQQVDVVGVDGESWSELYRFLASEAEGRLQKQRGLNVFVGDGSEFFEVEGLGAVAGRLIGLVHAVSGVIPSDDARLVDMFAPPPEPRQPVADGGIRFVAVEPVFNEGFDMFGFEGSGVRQIVAEVAEFAGYGGQAAQPVGLGAERAVAVVTAHFDEAVGQVVHHLSHLLSVEC